MGERSYLASAYLPKTPGQHRRICRHLSTLQEPLPFWNAFHTGQMCQVKSCLAKQPPRRLLTKMCRTLMDVAALSFPLPDSPPSLPLPLPLPAEDDFDGMLVDAEINAVTLQIWKYDLYAIVFPYGLDDGAKPFPPSARTSAVRDETKERN